MSFLFEKPKNGSIYYYKDISGWWDYETTPATATLIFSFFAVSWVLHTILLIMRRNYQPLKFRSPLLLWLSMTAQNTYVVLVCLRLMVSRPIFPCMLVVAMTLNVPPLTFFPPMLRAWRVMFVASINKWKGRIAERNFKNEDLSKSIRGLQILRFFVTTPFLLLLQGFIIAVHALITIIFFAVFRDKLIFTGCFVGVPTTATFVIMSFAYWVVAFVSTIFLYFVKEQWQINRGIYATMLFLTPTVLIWFLLGLIPFYDTILERYFPAAYWPVLGSFLDITFNTTLTIIRTWTYQRKKDSVQDSQQARVEQLKDLYDILRDPDSRGVLRTFATQSFCPEMVLFWEQAEEFKTKVMTDPKWDEEARRSFARKLVETYVDPAGPMQLNVTHAAEWHRVLMFMINDPDGAETRIQAKMEQLEEQRRSGTLATPSSAATPPPSPRVLDVLDESIKIVLLSRDDAVLTPISRPEQSPQCSASPSSEDSNEALLPADQQAAAAAALIVPMNRGIRPDIFDEIQHLVVRDMYMDLYSRFKQSKLFHNMRKMQQLQQSVMKTAGML